MPRCTSAHLNRPARAKAKLDFTAVPRRGYSAVWPGGTLDLAALALALPDNPQQANVLVSIKAVAGVTALDIDTAERLTVGV